MLVLPVLFAAGMCLFDTLDNVGFVVVGLFVLTWAVALAVWKLGRVEERWSAGLAARPEEG